MIKTVIFDLDDTLYDEIDYCKSGFASVSEHLAGLPGAPTAETVFDALRRQFAAGNRTKTFNTALEVLKIPYDEETISQLIRLYRTHTPNITLPPDSREVLDQLSRKYTLALLTDGFLPAQKLKVQALAIEDYFKTIVYTEELGREFWKPSPAGFEKILQTLNAQPQSTTYVADNESKDFIAPNTLQMPTIRLIRPNRIHAQISTDPNINPQQTRTAKPNHRIHKITDLPPLLDTL